MFGIKKEWLVKSLCKLAASHCGYMKQPCDCKYMPEDGSKFHSETTGCPEITMAATLIANMTTQEFLTVAKRGGIIISDNEESATDVRSMIADFLAQKLEKTQKEAREFMAAQEAKRAARKKKVK